MRGTPLSKSHPGIAAQWHPARNGGISPNEVSEGSSSRKYWWICEFGHEWEATVSHRTTGRGCPVCGNKQVLIGFNDLSSTHPEIAAEWHPSKNGQLLPTEFTEGSGRKIWWQCSLGHEWETQIGHRARRGSGCPYCAGKRIWPGFNDIATVNPLLASKWSLRNADILPTQVGAGSETPVWWVCPKGHDYLSTPASQSRGRGCSVCAGKQVIPEVNSFAFAFPDIAEEWDSSKNIGVEPTEITSKSEKKFWWKCSEGHSYETTPAVRAMGSGCPICSGNQILIGFNDLRTKAPQLVDEWAVELNESPMESFMPGSHFKAFWRCPIGHEWQADIANRVAGRGCPECRWATEGVSDLATLEPDLIKEWVYESNDPVKPTSLSVASGFKAVWRCEKGHTWKTSIANRTVVGTGCPTCSQKGYAPGIPGILYFLEHEELRARKVGITNAGKTRLTKFQRYGWNVLFTYESDNGQLIVDAETAILRVIRKELKMPPALGRQEMSLTGGWTETFSIDGIENDAVIELVNGILRKLQAGGM